MVNMTNEDQTNENGIIRLLAICGKNLIFFSQVKIMELKMNK